MVEPLDRGPERALGREAPYMEFIDYRLVPRPPGPVGVGPGKGAGVDDFARAVHILWLVTGCGIGNAKTVFQFELIA